MNFTTITYPIKSCPQGSNIMGHAKLNFGGVLEINDITISDGKKGVFVMMPRYLTKDQEYQDICYPCTAAAHETITNAILESFSKSKELGNPTMVTIGSSNLTPHFDIRITPFSCDGSNIRGYATVTLDGAFSIGRISIRENVNGNLYVLYPGRKFECRKDAAGNPLCYYVCELIDPEFESILTGTIINTFKQQTAAAGA